MLALDDLPAHTKIKKVLKTFVAEGVFPQTLLFSGPKGVGKTTCAYAFAHALLPDSQHLIDLMVFTPEGKANLHSIESIRRYIESTKLPPTTGKFKLFLFKQADRMLPASANALLKTLEEAPFFVITLLITSELDLILPTIQSRSFHLPFSSLSQEEILLYLKKKQSLSKETEKKILFLSRGSLAKAEELLGEEENSLIESFFKTAFYYAKRDYLKGEEALQELETLLTKKEKEHSLEMFDLLAYFWRDLYLLQTKSDADHLFFQGWKEELRQCIEMPLPSFQQIEKAIEEGKRAFQLGISFSACLEALFLSFTSY